MYYDAIAMYQCHKCRRYVSINKPLCSNTTLQYGVLYSVVGRTVSCIISMSYCLLFSFMRR